MTERLRLNNNNKKWEEMYNLNQENKAFGQFGWNGKFPEGRTDKKKSLKN